MSLAGSRPGGRPPFLLVQERRQRTRPQVCDPFAALRGKPVAGRLRGAPWNSLRAARSVQTTAANQFTMHARFDAHAHPASAPPQAQPQGVNSPIRAIAALGPASASRCADEAERSDGSYCWVPFWPCREAQGAGRACAEGHTPSWSDLPRLFERSASARSEFRGTPRARAPQVARSASEGTRTAGSPFLCSLSFGEAKESECAAGRTSRPATSKRRATAAIQQTHRQGKVLHRPDSNSLQPAGLDVGAQQFVDARLPVAPVRSNAWCTPTRARSGLTAWSWGCRSPGCTRICDI